MFQSYIAAAAAVAAALLLFVSPSRQVPTRPRGAPIGPTRAASPDGLRHERIYIYMIDRKQSPQNIDDFTTTAAHGHTHTMRKARNNTNN